MAESAATHVSEPPTRALEGVVILDLGQVYNGPYCTMLLRELGATVVKIEPFGGEPIRWRDDDAEGNQAFLMLNAGKRSLRLDLKKKRGKKLLLELVAVADVVVENFAPGVMEKLGLSFEELQAANGQIIMASGKGYGSSGPNSGMLGMDVTVQAMTGVIAATGFPDQPPVKAGPAVADFSGGVHLAAAILAALFHRERSGRGQHVEVAMQDAVLPFLTSNIAGHLEHGEGFPDRTGNRHGGLSIVPYNLYPTADGWIAILCLRPRHWLQLCAAMDRPDLAADDALSSPKGRVEEIEKVDDAVAEWTQRRPAQVLFEELQRAGVPCAPLHSLAEVIRDPHLRERGMLREIQIGDQTRTVLGSPLRLSDSSTPLLTAPPLLGEHSDEILRELLRLDEEELSQLHDSGVI